MKQRILIVEDDLTIQTQLKNLLSGNGYEVGVVSDFSKVIEQVKTFAPHLVLLDIKLPGNSGFDICSQVRTFSEIPIIFVTSSNTDMDELNSIMLGGDAFISKPYNMQTTNGCALSSIKSSATPSSTAPRSIPHCASSRSGRATKCSCPLRTTGSASQRATCRGYSRRDLPARMGGPFTAPQGSACISASAYATSWESGWPHPRRTKEPP